MLPEMSYIENELLPMLRERAPAFEENAKKQLRQWNGEKGICSLLLHVTDLPEAERLPVYDDYEIHYDPEKMFVNEFRSALSTALADGDGVPSVRANVGCAALCTLYGGLKQSFFHDKMPWLLKHLSPEEIREITLDSLEESEEFKTGLEQMKFMKNMLEGTGIQVYPMDLQGPIDMAHLFMGDEFFYSLYDDPELVYKALEMSLTAEIYGIEKCLEIIAPTEYVCHYNGLVLPADKPLKVSEDTSTLLSAEHLETFMRPYTERLLDHFGGGYIHYCGNNQHLLEMMPTFRKSIGLNFGNPERHDPELVLKSLAKAGKSYYGSFPGMSAAEQARLSRQESGWYNSFVVANANVKDQKRVLDEFHEAVQ
ncbi:MAG: hypothetical protein ACOYJR_06365 [Acutalibacteraceae bacterium]|jgi:hypothetical protein